MATQQTPTLQQPAGGEKRKLQILVLADSARRIKAAAAARDCEPGNILDELAATLPPVAPENEGA